MHEHQQIHSRKMFSLHLHFHFGCDFFASLGSALCLSVCLVNGFFFCIFTVISFIYFSLLVFFVFLSVSCCRTHTRSISSKPSCWPFVWILYFIIICTRCSWSTIVCFFFFCSSSFASFGAYTFFFLSVLFIVCLFCWFIRGKNIFHLTQILVKTIYHGTSTVC